MTLVLNGTTGVSSVDGSASTPAIQGNDSNTGIFFPAADTIAFAEGGAEVARFDSSGNLGIGTSSPSARLTVSGNQSFPEKTSAYIGVDAATSAGNGGDFTVKAGTGSGAGNTAGKLFLAAGRGNSSSSNGYIAFGVSQSTNAVGLDNEYARITSAGDFLVGTTSTSTPTTSTADVYLGGIAMTPSRRTTASAANVNIDPTSGLFARSTSSLKYKRDVENATHGLAEVMALRPVTYKGKSEADGDKVFGGLIAEEVHEAGLTEFVQYAGDGSPDSLAYGNMVALCIKAIQELNAKVEALEAQLAGAAS